MGDFFYFVRRIGDFFNRGSVLRESATSFTAVLRVGRSRLLSFTAVLCWENRRLLLPRFCVVRIGYFFYRVSRIRRVGDFFYCVGRMCDFFYRVSGFFFLRTGACFLLFVDVFHLSNNDAVKERKKEKRDIFAKCNWFSSVLTWVQLRIKSWKFFVVWISLKSTRLHPSSVQSQMKPSQKMAEAAAKAANMLYKQHATKLAGVAFISYEQRRSIQER